MRADFRIGDVAERVEGPLLFLRRTVNVGLNEALHVIGRDGVPRLGRVATLDEDSLIVEVLETTAGLGIEDTVVSILGEPVCLDVGPNMLGRVFDSVGRPLDGGTPIPAMRRMRIDGMTINPARRALPRDFIETGVTAIDLMNSLVRGQKLPLFSGGGLPHDRLATSIAQRARLRDSDSGEFAVVFVGIGVSHDIAESFRAAMESSGALGHTAMFLNRADESSAQRLLTPRFALTAAEYLAFTEGRHVLVIMTDMTNYCEALREVSASHGEIPGRKGFPGYMYSDLATLFERAGCLHGRKGTLTQLPILTLPGDDIGHPIPDLTGYITEGQFYLHDGVIDPFGSLSRLKQHVVGKVTREDHSQIMTTMVRFYSNAKEAEQKQQMSFELSDFDHKLLRFGKLFYDRFMRIEVSMPLEKALDLAWQTLAECFEPQELLMKQELIDRYYLSNQAGDDSSGQETAAAG